MVKAGVGTSVPASHTTAPETSLFAVRVRVRWDSLSQLAVVEGNGMEEIKDGMPDEQQVLELGIMLGQRRAFGMVAGRCSAAQAECLRKVRDEKTYLKFATNWAEFCERQLKISK